MAFLLFTLRNIMDLGNIEVMSGASSISSDKLRVRYWEDLRYFRK